MYMQNSISQFFSSLILIILGYNNIRTDVYREQIWLYVTLRDSILFVLFSTACSCEEYFLSKRFQKSSNLLLTTRSHIPCFFELLSSKIVMCLSRNVAANIIQFSSNLKFSCLNFVYFSRNQTLIFNTILFTFLYSTVE